MVFVLYAPGMAGTGWSGAGCVTCCLWGPQFRALWAAMHVQAVMRGAWLSTPLPEGPDQDDAARVLHHNPYRDQLVLPGCISQGAEHAVP